MASAFIFRLNSKEEEKKEFVVKYSSAQDQYVRLNAEEPIPKGWQSGVKTAVNLRRKHESDWKMVYLSRTGEQQAWVCLCDHWVVWIVSFVFVFFRLAICLFFPSFLVFSVCVS